MTTGAKPAGKLEVTLPSDREIAMTRVFDAPRRLVYDAVTKPELVKRWLGVFGGHVMEVCEIDLRVGGAYRYVWRNRDGSTMAMGGVYTRIVPQERIDSTEVFDDPWYEGQGLGTLTLSEKDGRTTMRTVVLYDSKEIRDGILKSGMEGGVAASYDGLEGILKSQR
jgi:uncharacterized protein YndB with AHSA1/START domain